MNWQDFYDWYIKSGPRNPDQTMEEHLMRFTHGVVQVTWVIEDELLPIIKKTLAELQKFEAALL